MRTVCCIVFAVLVVSIPAHPTAADPPRKKTCTLPSPWSTLGISDESPSCQTGAVTIKWDSTPVTDPYSTDPAVRRRAAVVSEAGAETFYWCWRPPGESLGQHCSKLTVEERCDKAFELTPKDDGYLLVAYETLEIGGTKVASLRKSKRVHHDEKLCRTSSWTREHQENADERSSYDANNDGVAEIHVRRGQHPCGFPDRRGRGGGCRSFVSVECDFNGDGKTDERCRTDDSKPASRSPDGGCGPSFCSRHRRWKFGPITSSP